MEKIFVLIALTFVGIFQQADTAALVTYTNLEQFKEIFLRFAGRDKSLDFGELMLMIGRRIMKYDDLDRSLSLEEQDDEIYGTLLYKTVQQIWIFFSEMAGEDKQLTIDKVEKHYTTTQFKELFDGTWNELQVASPPQPNPQAAENL